MIPIDLKKNEKGFSLVELSTLLAMTALLAAISIPMLSSSMRSMQLASDAKSIATTMTYAKLSASSQMTRYRLTFNLSGNTWWLGKFNPTTGNYDLQNGNNGLAGGVGNSGIVFKSFSSTAPLGFSTSSSTTVTFSSRGTPVSSEGPGIVYVTDNVDNYAVTTSLSGKVQVWRYRNSQWISQ